MRKLYVLLLGGLIVSCGAETPENPENNPEITDTSSSGIIEYDLNEDRLSAVDYNNELSLIQQNVYDQINILFLSDPESVDQNFENVTFEVELKTNSLENIKAPEGGEAFKTALQDLLSFYQTELDEGFAAIIPLLKKEQEERSQAEEYQIIDYDEQFAIKEEALFKVIMVEQEKFAAANNFKIGE